MSFHRLVPGTRGTPLKSVLLEALREAYDENVARHAPDDIGDNNTTFGVNITHNLRFLVEHAVAGIDGVEPRRPRNSFYIEIDERFAVYFYKAPPGVTNIHSLRFDESEMKLEITKVNARQLQFDYNADGAESRLAISADLPTHAVIVHFGDPDSGFRSATIGAPFRAEDGGCDWAWEEPFDQPDDGFVVVDEPDEDDSSGGFGLTLRNEEAEEGDKDEAPR